MSPGRIPKQAYMYKRKGRRGLGRSCKQWKAQAKIGILLASEVKTIINITSNKNTFTSII
jgi:hypothetical protein